ncbi:tail assembly protein [Escherichia phage KW1E_UTAR]|nr:tail assembly protein [Escherichia phage KW1E_UTAR]
MALKTIRLYGRLGALFGRVHRLHIETCSEAIRALCVTVDGFEQYLRDSKSMGIRFACFKGKRNVGVDQLALGLGEEDFRIAPVLAGAKKGGVFQTILGAVMVVAGIVATFIPGAQAAAPYLIAGGISTMAGGVIQLLTPQPPGMSQRQDADNKPSYAFGQPVNTTAQGNPVGILWGEREIGGAVIGAGIIANEVRN